MILSYHLSKQHCSRLQFHAVLAAILDPTDCEGRSTSQYLCSQDPATSAVPFTVVAKDALGASSFALVVFIARQRSLVQLSTQLVVSFLETSQQETSHSLLHC